MRLPFALLCGIVLVLPVATAQADVRLPAVFSDHMVLQREAAASVWGWADAGEDVSVTVGPAAASAKAGADGRWAVRLEKLPAAAAGPLAMTVRGKNKLTVNDVLVGEVWLCSGQSNMAMQVSRARDADEERGAATFPQVRMFTVGRNPQRTPQADCEGRWVVCSPEAVGAFSATAYFFGRELHRAVGVPVGLINSSYGGTDIAAWTSEAAQLPVPELKAQLDDWARRDQAYDQSAAQAAYEKQASAWREAATAARAGGKRPPRQPQRPVRPGLSQNHPANLFNGMIAPVLPYTIRGAIWYQGEANTRDEAGGLLYRKQLPLLVRDWRARWGYDFPVGFVQLPNFTRRGEGWPLVREAMLLTLDAVPDTGMAITIDVGDPNDIHPANKQDVGRRLAMWALASVYGKTDVAASGPLPAGHEVRGGEVVVAFKHAHGGLAARGGGPLKGFTVAGEDGRFVPAAVRIDGERVVVSSPDVAKPAAVRYAWQDNPDCNLTNGAGLPASPFRTDVK